MLTDIVAIGLHNEFKRLLEGATGVSELILAISVDMRAFSTFSKKTDSYLVGVFVKQVYKRIIEQYFPNPAFFKSPGDGLLIVLSCNESNILDLVPNAVSTCLKLIEEFKSFFEKDHLVNFPVPNRIGIGIARGPVTRLESEGKILDYSGNTLK